MQGSIVNDPFGAGTKGTSAAGPRQWQPRVPTEPIFQLMSSADTLLRARRPRSQAAVLCLGICMALTIAAAAAHAAPRGKRPPAPPNASAISAANARSASQAAGADFVDRPGQGCRPARQKLVYHGGPLVKN